MPTYKDVFWVELGEQVTESKGINYKACPAADSLKRVLLTSRFFQANRDKLQGMGPIWRDPGFQHEYNRHHAGLAVDIMLTAGSDEETLGQHLVVLFSHFANIIKFRGMIYQDVTVDLWTGGTYRASRWTKGGHDDHIHIDWHDDGNTRWSQPLTDTIPLLRPTGQVVQMVPRDPSKKIATSIAWTQEAMRTFDAAPMLREALPQVVGVWESGTAPPIDLNESLMAAHSPAAEKFKNQLIGTWNASVGGWQGIFVFDAQGSVYWADNAGSVRHQGRWYFTTDDLQWQFNDPGDFRVFTLPYSQIGNSRAGDIDPAGQGGFRMTKQ